MADLADLIFEHADQLHALHARVHELFAKQPHGPAHHAACATFHASFDRLAFPGGLQLGLERLRRGDPSAVEAAIRFLEVNPWFYRSGYIKQEIVQRLKHADLSAQQRARLAPIVLRSLRDGTRRDARHLARLAPLVDLPSFAATFEAEVRESRSEAQRRARHVLEVLRSSGSRGIP